MSLKFVLLVSALTVAAAIELHHHQPLILKHSHEIEHEHDHHAPAKYEFSYSVHDKHTGDIKSQKEVRHGDKVEGHYELIDSDGHRRIVHYRADKHSGFEAVVHREPTDIKIPIPEHHSHKLIAHKILTPVVHHSISPVHSLNLVHSDHGDSHSHSHHVQYSGHGASYHY